MVKFVKKLIYLDAHASGTNGLRIRNYDYYGLWIVSVDDV